MSELIGLFNLLAPFFGLIGLGFFCGRVVRQHEAGLAWMQFFLIYVALPCLFFRLIADKPLDQLANWRFIAVTTLSTFIAFALAFGSGWRYTRDLPQSVMQGVAGSYSNVGYMGPPLVLGALGAGSERSGGADLRLRQPAAVLARAIADVGGGLERLSCRRDLQEIVWRILTHPFNVATALGDRRKLSPPAPAAGRRPDGHLALGGGGALRALHPRRDRGPAAPVAHPGEACRRSR